MECLRISGFTGILVVVAGVNASLFLVLLLHKKILRPVYRQTFPGLHLDLTLASGGGIPNNQAIGLR